MKLLLINVFGTLAAIASSLIFLYALPKEIYKSFKDKLKPQLPTSWIWIGFAVYFLWAVYAFLKADWLLFCPQLAGAVLSLILVFQFLFYPAAGE